ncbi:hypothetical protein AB0D40_37020 [Streptomyces massasporeus]|uniref:hypothetical protein n=1 Tax=Streptomyces massasporeus TaxID=67324 RepID=UPI0033E2FD0A
MAIDAWGLKRLMQDLEVVLRALATGDEPPSAESLTHPSERLDFEQSAAGVKRSQESVRYWTQQLALFRPASCPESGNAPESPRFKEVWLKSKAVSVAAHCLASP